MGDLIGAFAGLLEGIGGSPLGQIILSVIAGLILLEIIGVIEFGAVRLLRFGTKLLPPAFRERYIEENEAVIRSVSGPFAKVVCTVSAVLGVIRLRTTLSREELERLEQKSHKEKVPALYGDKDSWMRLHNKIQYLHENFGKNFPHDKDIKYFYNYINWSNCEIIIDEKEFHEIIKTFRERQNRDD